MFETKQDTMESIDFEKIFDNQFDTFNPELKDEITRLNVSMSYRSMYSCYNTQRNSELLIRRPDITITMNLLKEITPKGLGLAYTGTNFTTIVSRDILEADVQSLQQMQGSTIRGIIKDCLPYGYGFGVFPSSAYQGTIVFGNVIKGASFLTKLKQIDISKADNEEYKFTRLKNLELQLMENRFDNTMCIKIENIEEEKTLYYVLTNKYTWLKIRKTVSKVFELFPNLVLTNLNENLLNKTKFLFEKLGSENNDNTAWKDTLISILTDPERKNQKLLLDIEKLLVNTKKEQEDKLKYELRKQQSDIQRLENDMIKTYENMRKTEGMILRLDKDPELKEKILEALEFANKSKLITTFELYPDDKRIKVIVDAPIRYFDPEYAKVLYKNLHEDRNDYRPNDGSAFKQLFNELFLEDKYTLMCTTRFDIHFYRNGNNYEAPLTYTLSRFSEHELTYLGQPHINGYACLGNNKIDAARMCKEFDLLGLLALLTNCAQNLNLTDSTVFSSFRDVLLGSAFTKPTIRNNETGEIISFKDYYTEHNKVTYKNEIVNELKEKYENKALTDEEITYLAKALKSFKSIYATGHVAKQIILELRHTDNVHLAGNTSIGSFYTNAIEREQTIELNYENNTIKGSTHSNYWEILDRAIGNEEIHPLLFTTFLEELEENKNEPAVSKELAEVVAEEIGMPF